MTKLDEATLELLTNEDLLRILSPKHVPHQIRHTETEAVWYTKQAHARQIHVALFNLDDTNRTVEAELGQIEEQCGYEKKEEIALFDLWTKEQKKVVDGRILAELKPHACVIYRLELQDE